MPLSAPLMKSSQPSKGTLAMLSLTKRFAAVTLCIFVLCLVANAQTEVESQAAPQFDEYGRWINGIGEPWYFNDREYTADQIFNTQMKWKAIEDLQPTTKDDWAGAYVIGWETSARHVRWSPEKGFVDLRVSTCAAAVTKLDYGEVVVKSPTSIEFISNIAGHETKRTFVKVKWGEQRYLVEESEVQDFCDYIVGLGKFNNSAYDGAVFLIKGGDGGNPTAEMPTVPSEFQQYVRKPFHAEITKVGKPYIEVDSESDQSDELITPVTINIGSNHGLKRDTALPILDTQQFSQTEKVIITRVAKTYALGIIVRYIEKGHGDNPKNAKYSFDEECPPVAVGWKLTTSRHKTDERADELFKQYEEAEKVKQKEATP